MVQTYIEQNEDQIVPLAIAGHPFEFHIFAFRNLMYIDIYDGERDMTVVAGKRLMANQWLLPNYIAEGVGNIRFETYSADRDDYVWYDGFNKKFRLMSYGAEELAELEESEKEID